MFAIKKSDTSQEEEEYSLSDSSWKMDVRTGKYTEVGPEFEGFKLRKLKIKLKDDHLLEESSENGAVKVRVNVNNVNNIMVENGLDRLGYHDSLPFEERSAETHPFICPFICPTTSQHCEAMFRPSEQKYFEDHVVKGACPYAVKGGLKEPLMTCKLCLKQVVESGVLEHLRENHLSAQCPACPHKFQDRKDVEDHIINQHATHQLSSLKTVYRKAEPAVLPPPAPLVEEGMNLPDWLYLEDVKKLDHTCLSQMAPSVYHPQLQPRPRLLTPPQGVAGQSGLLRTQLAGPPGATTTTYRLAGPNTVRPRQYRPRQPRATAVQYRSPQAPTPVLPAAALLPSHHRPTGLLRSKQLRQLQLPSGQLVWAEPTGSEKIPGSNKSNVKFKIIGPVNMANPSQLPSSVTNTSQLTHQINQELNHRIIRPGTEPKKVYLPPSTQPGLNRLAPAPAPTPIHNVIRMPGQQMGVQSMRFKPPPGWGPPPPQGGAAWMQAAAARQSAPAPSYQPNIIRKGQNQILGAPHYRGPAAGLPMTFQPQQRPDRLLTGQTAVHLNLNEVMLKQKAEEHYNSLKSNSYRTVGFGKNGFDARAGQQFPTLTQYMNHNSQQQQLLSGGAGEDQDEGVDPLAEEEGVDPLAGLDPYENSGGQDKSDDSIILC